MSSRLHAWLVVLVAVNNASRSTLRNHTHTQHAHHTCLVVLPRVQDGLHLQLVQGVPAVSCVVCVMLCMLLQAIHSILFCTRNART